MTALKIKAGRLFLALGLGLSMAAMVTGVTGCMSDDHPSNPNQSPVYYKPTFSGDEHDPPVYTSPSVTPATNHSLNANPPP